MRRNRRPRFERFTLVMAVTRSEVVAHETVRGSMNSERFAAFVLGIPDHFRGHALLMDNVRFHHTRQVAEAMAAKHFRPVFIPPYSPQFNPIENAFSVMKSQFRRLHEVEDTEQRILLAIQALTAPKLDGFYRHTEQHILLLRNELA
jgi:transposase